ncbi:MAG: hypothetical protein JNN12_05745 [Bacteroidetes Order II. Incertae sedis bacterium]|nr:hypothetical protein [Bacteroidetes Order II. bacterium]
MTTHISFRLFTLWCVWMLCGPNTAMAQAETNLTLINGTGKAISRLYVRLSDEMDWGKSILSGVQRLAPNEKLMVTLFDWEDCQIDVQARGTDRKILYEAKGLDMCATDTFTLGKTQPPRIVVIPSTPHSPITRIEDQTGSKLTPVQATALLDAHNRVRIAEGVPIAGWETTLADFAQQWANQLAQNGCRMQHRPREGTWKQRYGENLFMQQSTGSLAGFNYQQVVQAWADEKQHYTPGPLRDFSSYPDQVGHYTQVIWATSTQLGCGVSTCQVGGWNTLLVVCNYNPPGNYIGQDPLSPRN